MLFCWVLCFWALAATASANQTANMFFDKVINDMRYDLNGLDPMQVTPFQFTVKSTSITNNDLKANFTRGSMYGLGRLRRHGDCYYRTFGDKMKMGCYLMLAPLNMRMIADVKGDSSWNNVHAISTQTTVASSAHSIVEIQGRRGQTAKLGSIKTISPVTMTTSVVQGTLDLTTERFADFVRQTHHHLSNQLVYGLQVPYGGAMQKLLSSRVMP